LTTAGRALRLAASLLAAAAALTACGDDDAGTENANGVGPQRGGSSAALATCGDWRRGSEEERQVTIDDLREALTPQTSETPSQALDNDEAYDLLERACHPAYARGFRLYKLYAHAAAFEPLQLD
jgi:hypothetical protein